MCRIKSLRVGDNLYYSFGTCKVRKNKFERIKNNKNRPLLNEYDGFEKFKNLYDDRVRFYAEADISIVNNQNCSIDEMGKRTVDKFLSFINSNLE